MSMFFAPSASWRFSALLRARFHLAGSLSLTCMTTRSRFAAPAASATAGASAQNAVPTVMAAIATQRCGCFVIIDGLLQIDGCRCYPGRYAHYAGRQWELRKAARPGPHGARPRCDPLASAHGDARSRPAGRDMRTPVEWRLDAPHARPHVVDPADPRVGPVLHDARHDHQVHDPALFGAGAGVGALHGPIPRDAGVARPQHAPQAVPYGTPAAAGRSRRGSARVVALLRRSAA